MARPVKWRKIENVPTVSRFVPAKRASAEDAENTLKLEELEAVRLKDLEGLEQEDCAGRMEISRATYQRILLSARGKIADSLVNGKAICINGGYFTQNICLIRCVRCGYQWMERFEKLNAVETGAYRCPNCGSGDIACGHSCGEQFGRGHCRRHGRMNR
ncbi:MAG: DUF134 domain-containing protein [Clostridiales bacterium]|nr:DUF134 domain-containing protein [Clostridiales bacterium]